MRNSALRTVTTNSRGVKSSLTRMTLCSRGRSVLVLTLVLDLVTVSIIARHLLILAQAAPQEYRLPGVRQTGCFRWFYGYGGTLRKYATMSARSAWVSPA